MLIYPSACRKNAVVKDKTQLLPLPSSSVPVNVTSENAGSQNGTCAPELHKTPAQWQSPP